MSNIIAIVGRPNVGKSTLFNRLTGMRHAIVDEVAGVTRDRQYGKSEWTGIPFSVIDTGGYVTNSDDVFEGEIRKQVALAIEEADVIMFMVDVQNGITDLDDAIANILRRQTKPVLLIANKVDTPIHSNEAMEFYGLGFGELHAISAMNGSGTGDMLDAALKLFPKEAKETVDDTVPRICVVGRPNAGKSSFINALIGEDRHIVTDVAGTTRDSIETKYNKFNYEFYITDTAGLRKKNKVHEDLEYYSVLRSVRAIEHSDVCMLMIDAERGVEAQDLSIFHLIKKNSKGVVILVNKWDLIEKDNHSTNAFTKAVLERTAPFTDIPIVFISALTKQRIHKSLEVAMDVFKNRTKKIKTSELNDVMLEVINQNPPPSLKGKHIKIKYVTQLPTYTPSFAFYCNLPQYVKEPYKRYLENKMREHFDFSGVPINIFMRKK
ncbi:MAG: ribosome biogenesis GTPase Der [Bacteroidales bacterium]